MDLTTTTLSATPPDDHVSAWPWPRTGSRFLPGRHRHGDGRTPVALLLTGQDDIPPCPGCLSPLCPDCRNSLATDPNGDLR